VITGKPRGTAPENRGISAHQVEDGDRVVRAEQVLLYLVGMPAPEPRRAVGITLLDQLNDLPVGRIPFLLAWTFAGDSTELYDRYFCDRADRLRPAA
jgi:hypothetical protein